MHHFLFDHELIVHVVCNSQTCNEVKKGEMNRDHPHEIIIRFSPLDLYEYDLYVLQNRTNIYTTNESIIF